MSFKKEEIYKKRICKIELYPCPETLVAVERERERERESNLPS